MWKGKIKSGCFNVQYVSIFLSLDYQFSVFQVENNVLKRQLGNFDIKNCSVQFDNRNQLVDFSFIEKGLLWDTTKNFKFQLLECTLQDAQNIYFEHLQQMGYQEMIDQRRLSIQT